MEQDDRIFEEIGDFPNHVQLDPSVTEEAVKLTRELYGKGKAIRRKRALKRGLACGVAAALALAVVLPVSIHFATAGNGEQPSAEEPNAPTEGPGTAPEAPPAEDPGTIPEEPSEPVEPSEPESPKYYLGDALRQESVSDLAQFVSDNELEVFYFTTALSTSANAYFIIETNELGYIHQSAFFMGGSGFETVTLYINESGYQFAQFEYYQDFESEQTVDCYSVKYKIVEKNGMYTATCKIVSGEVEYYLIIETAESDGNIEDYVKLLFQITE